MSDFIAIFDNSLFQFAVLAILALAAVVAGPLTPLLYRRYKSFSCEVVSVTRIVSVGSKFRESVQVLFDGEPVKDVRVVVFRFFNSGNVPILVEDFHQAVGVRFRYPSRILSSTVEVCEPKSLDVELVSDGQTLSLKPTLFNKGDSITVGMVVRDYGGYDTVGRIVGVGEIAHRKAESRFDKFARLYIRSFWISLLPFYFIIFVAVPRFIEHGFAIWFSLLFSVALVVGIVTLVIRSKS